MPFESFKKRFSKRFTRQPENFWQLSLNSDELITKNILNLSESGLAFKAPLWFEHQSGEKLHLKLKLEKSENTAVERDAHIIWSKKFFAANETAVKVGLQFDEKISLETDCIQGGVHANRPPSITTALALEQLDFRKLITRLTAGLCILILTAALVAAIYVHRA